ncbi:protease inhibitor I42 family protein [Deinococcus gobiensis]|nr:protease inhibitor I42 family protein [Deinococcus gobiensis]
MKLLRLLLCTLGLTTAALATSGAGAGAAGMSVPRTVQVQPGMGTTLTVQAGDVLRFVLPDAPGTGYTWRALEVDGEYLALVGKTHAAQAAPAGPPVVGGPGPDLVYVYRVVKTPRSGRRAAGPARGVRAAAARTPGPRPKVSATLFYLIPGP